MTSFTDILTNRAKSVVPLHIDLDCGCYAITPESDLNEFIQKTEETFSIPLQFDFEPFAKVFLYCELTNPIAQGRNKEVFFQVYNSEDC